MREVNEIVRLTEMIVQRVVDAGCVSLNDIQQRDGMLSNLKCK